MPSGFLSTLTNAARTAWPLIQAGVRGGLSTRALGTLLATFDLRLAAGELSAIVAKEREIQRLGAALRFLNRDVAPNPFRLPEALTTIRRPFSFTVEVRGFLIETGERTVQNVTVTSSTLLTRAQMEELAIQAVTSGAERYGLEVESALPIRGVRAGVLGTF